MDFICEAFDQMQRAFDLNGFNDHQLHCVLRFDSGVAPDAAILRRARGQRLMMVSPGRGITRSSTA